MMGAGDEMSGEQFVMENYGDGADGGGADDGSIGNGGDGHGALMDHDDSGLWWW